jgi:hypothetical protein
MERLNPEGTKPIKGLCGRWAYDSEQGHERKSHIAMDCGSLAPQNISNGGIGTERKEKGRLWIGDPNSPREKSCHTDS